MVNCGLPFAWANSFTLHMSAENKKVATRPNIYLSGGSCAVQKAAGELANPNMMLMGQRQSRSWCSGPCELKTTVAKTQILAQWPVSEWPGNDSLSLIDVLTTKQLKIGSQKNPELVV